MFIEVTQREIRKEGVYDKSYILNLNHIISVNQVSLPEAISNGFRCEITMIRGVIMVIDSWKSIYERIDELRFIFKTKEEK